MLPACLPLPGPSLTLLHPEQGCAYSECSTSAVEGMQEAARASRGQGLRGKSTRSRPAGQGQSLFRTDEPESWGRVTDRFGARHWCPLTSGVCRSGQAGPELWRRPKLGAPVRPGPSPHLKFSSTFPRQALVLGVGPLGIPRTGAGPWVLLRIWPLACVSQQLIPPRPEASCRSYCPQRERIWWQEAELCLEH